MTETSTPSTSFKIVHWVAFVLLLMVVVQPTFDNVRALINGTMVMGDVTIDVTFSKMALHLVAMTVGWVGLGLFFKRKKLGAYISIAAHVLGLVAVMTQTPEMLDAIPAVFLVVFFVGLLVVALGPILAFKDEYS